LAGTLAAFAARQAVRIVGRSMSGMAVKRPIRRSRSSSVIDTLKSEKLTGVLVADLQRHYVATSNKGATPAGILIFQTQE
jgi:hypothetical protein